MELELSLGDASSKPFAFMEKSHRQVSNKGLAFSMGLGLVSVGRDREEEKTREAVVDVDDDDDDDDDDDRDEDDDGRDQTQRLLPLLPVSRAQASHQALPWPSDNGNHIHMPPNHKRVFFLGFLFLFGFFVLGGGGFLCVFCGGFRELRGGFVRKRGPAGEGARREQIAIYGSSGGGGGGVGGRGGGGGGVLSEQCSVVFSDGFLHLQRRKWRKQEGFRRW